eukprot:TRINITY_DN1088_c0_g1_i1.p1 TRINITY_DN1088_c0_g1~~TRINITY_DN1088_c0_g1_i1.p1  ORF type:complete len:2437 (+),score=480.84 TRINITY_DN1088_c0_g1_i1:402-7313(+)
MHCPDMGCDLSYNTTSKMTSCVPFGDACTMHANAEDCTTNGLCAWDQGTLTCAPKALADIECPDVPLLSCMRNGCGLRRNECIECDSIVEKDQCTTVSGCSWTNQVCMPEDRRAVGCSFISEAEQCKADKSCHFTAGKQCVDKSSMDCILKETEAECTTAGESCSWNGQCITNWAEACSALSADGCAYRPDCAWGQGACEAIPPMAACKARTVNKEVCEALPGCTFFPDPEDEDGDCVSGIFDFDDGVCSDMNEATCRNPANKCHWAAKSNACVPAVCSIMGEDDCAKADHCQERNGLCVPANLNLATAKECTLADFSTACQGRMCEGVSDVWATNNGAPRPLNMVPQNSKTPPFVTQLWEMAVMNTECSVEALLTDRCDLCREGYIMNDLVPVRCERDNVYVEGELCVMPLPTMDCPFKASCFTDKPDPGPNPGGPMTGCTGLDQATCVAQPVDDPYGDGAEYRPCEWVYGSCQEKQWKAAGCYKRDATSCEGAVDGQNPYSLSCFMHENKCKIRDQQACDADTGAGLPTNVALASLLSFCNDCDIWPTGTGYRCQTYRCTSTALKADCSGSCQYDDATLTCNDVEACNKKSLMACSYHLPCGLKGDACIPCSEMVTEPACSDTMGCAWDGGVCKGSERRGCEEREDEASCASGDRCVWVAPFNHCKEKDDVSCFGLPKEACGFRDANAQPCVWLDEMATSDPACVPNVDGAQCADLALEHCVFREDCVQKDGKCAAGVLGEACDRVGDHPGCNYFPGCTLISTPFGEYECKAGVVDFAVAPAGECKSITDMAECAALPNCFVAPFTFDTGPGTQVTVYGCAPLLCDTLDATRCRAAGKCDWEAGLCVPKGFDVTTAPATCNRLNLATACNGGTAPCANVQTMWSSAQHELAYRSSPAGRPYLPPLIQNWAALQVLPPRVDGCTLAMMSAGECDFCTPGFVEFPFLPVDCDAAGNMIIHGQICIKPEAPTACPFKMSCSEEAPCEMRAPTAADCSAERCELKDGACLTKGAGGAKPSPTNECKALSMDECKAAGHCMLHSGVCTTAKACSELTTMQCGNAIPRCVVDRATGKCMDARQDDDCASSQCGEAKCFDSDRMANGKGVKCICTPPMVYNPTALTCVEDTSGTACDAATAKMCALEDRACASNKCVAAPCNDMCTTVTLPAGCTWAMGPKRADGCKLFPCDYTCEGECTTAEKQQCGQQRCEKVGADATKCVDACPEPRCPPPSDGCMIVDDDRVDPATGCKLFPCGTERCRDECEPKDVFRCAKEKAVCVMLSGKAECKQGVDCPEPACEAPDGCRFEDPPTWELDNRGCKVEPCGRRVCDRCSKEETVQAGCCDLSKGVDACKACVKLASGNVCVEPPCALQEACVAPSPACHYERSSDDKCGCGKLKCRALDPCENFCDAEEICRVFKGEAQCFSKPKPMECDCKNGKVCVELGGTKKCMPPPGPCASMRCAAGTVCVGDAAAGTAKCVDMRDSLCGGCEEDQVCKPSYAGAAGTREWKCQAKPAAVTDLCKLDACSCDGAPCEDNQVCAMRSADAKPNCVRDNVFDLLDKDPCWGLACSGDTPLCQVQRGGKAVCVTEEERRPRGVEATCDPVCADTEKCIFDAAAHVSVCVGKDTCDRKRFLKGLLENTCQADTDCAHKPGYICPSFASTEPGTAVSAYCSCDEATGETSECVGAEAPDLRRCIPATWDCDDDIAEVVEKWPEAQKKWCCTRRQRGCDAANRAYMCEPRGSDAVETWSDARKQSCCAATNKRVGCRTLARGEFDCSTREIWTPAKRAWCCKNQKVGCDPSRVDKDLDCTADSFDPTNAATSKADVKFCCMVHGVGCDVPPHNVKAPFNCATRERFSKSKREYCCKTQGVGCPKPVEKFDCDEDEKDASTWTKQQRFVCCVTTGRGCKKDDDAGDEGPYSCADLSIAGKDSDVNFQKKRRWCCVNQRQGCLEQQKCDAAAVKAAGVKPVSEITEATRKVCCSKFDRYCEFECPADLASFADASQQQKDYCCDQKGIACNAAAIATGVMKDKEEREKRPRAVLMIAFEALWEDIASNPKDFIRKVTSTLAMSLVDIEGDDLEIALQKLGPLTDDGKVPTADTAADLFSQFMEPPSAWAEDPETKDPLGSVETHRKRGKKFAKDTERAAELRDLIGSAALSGRRGAQALQTFSALGDGRGAVAEVAVLGSAAEAGAKELQRRANGELMDGSNEGATFPFIGAAPSDITVLGGPEPASDDDNTGMIVGTVVGSVAGALLCAGIAFFLVSKNKESATFGDVMAADADGHEVPLTAGYEPEGKPPTTV